MELLLHSLSRSVLVLSSIGVAVLFAVTLILFRRKDVVTSAAKLSTTVTTSLAILGLFVALLSAFQTFVAQKVQSHPAEHAPKMCSEDPVTKKPYAEELTFLPQEHLTGEMKRDAAIWRFTKQFPGPVTVVTASQQAAYVTIESCDADGNIIRCTGTTKTSNFSPISVGVKWLQPCE
jgi:hypothetical protein